MCSLFGEGEMEQNYQGDLTDIFRASSGSIAQDPLSDWQFDSSNMSSAMEESIQYFGDPFSNMRDPFLNELDIAGSSFFNTPNSADGSNSNILTQRILPQISTISPCDSPAMAAASPRGIKASAMLPTDMINVNSSKGCLLDNTATGVQISSPRNPVAAVKRRKSQAKKVVCIPAPAAVNSRPTGEVVPSDLWAWRKYGQKPIKGSPYPRGYYRCSSSKGCSARKQVERSRNDPKMLVITYTSEHNHPWPTQKNALAGSTRSQPSKNNINNASSALKTTSASPSSTTQKETITKEEAKDIESVSVGGGSSSTSACVKEEIEDIDKQLDIDDTKSYRPAMPDNQSDHNLFADLEEIEAVPGNLLFPPEFNGDGQQESKTTLQDPFDLFDWSGDNNG